MVYKLRVHLLSAPTYKTEWEKQAQNAAKYAVPIIEAQNKKKWVVLFSASQQPVNVTCHTYTKQHVNHLPSLYP